MTVIILQRYKLFLKIQVKWRKKAKYISYLIILPTFASDLKTVVIWKVKKGQVEGEPLYLDNLRQGSAPPIAYVCGKKSGVRFETM